MRQPGDLARRSTFFPSLSRENTMRNYRYADFRKAGWTAKYAKYAADAVAAFRELEDDSETPDNIGAVRLICEPESEPYDPGCEGYLVRNGHPVSIEDERKQTAEMPGQYGNWWLRTEVWDGKAWQHADSIGGCAGYVNPESPIENEYVADLMQSAVDASRLLTAEIDSALADALSMLA